MLNDGQGILCDMVLLLSNKSNFYYNGCVSFTSPPTFPLFHVIHKVFQAQGGINLIPFHQVTLIVRLLFCPATAVNSALHDVYIEYLQVQIEVGASPGLVLKA